MAVEDWEVVENSLLRGEGFCWSLVSIPNGGCPTVCGLLRGRGQVLMRLFAGVTCPVCVKWLKARGKLP